MTFDWRTPRKAMKRSEIKRTRMKPKRRTTAEKAAKFAREYHSAERVQWIAAQPCIVSGAGPCENVHVKGDGMSRKAGYEHIVPMTTHWHRELHRTGVRSFAEIHRIDFAKAAAWTHARWLAESGEAGQVATCDPNFWPEVVE